MAPKKITDHLRVARQSPLPEGPEEGDYNDAENNPPLNKEGALNPTFDPIVASPSGKSKSPASSSATTFESPALQPDTISFLKSRQCRKASPEAPVHNSNYDASVAMQPLIPLN